MKIGKPKRKFLVRIIDLETQKSLNISLYQEDGERIPITKVYKIVRRALERGLAR